VWGGVAAVAGDTLSLLIIQVANLGIVSIVAWNQLAQHKSAFGVSVSDYLD
jgi:hypothetical protein